MNNREKFEQDLTTLMSRLTIGVEKEVENKLNMLKEWLLKLQRENIVKINHSVMELVCAKHLILKGYEVQLEYPLNEILTCDLYSIKGYGNLIVEIETGIIRYNSFAGKFALGMPPHYVLPFPHALAKPPRKRTTEEVEAIKNLCDRYYKNPPVTTEEICNARIQELYTIDVDQAKVKEIDPEAYMKSAFSKDLFSDYTTS